MGGYGITHNRMEDCRIAIITILTAFEQTISNLQTPKLTFEIAFNIAKKLKVLLYIYILRVDNDVPAGKRCPVFMKSSPTVFQDELQLGVGRLH